jgi:hypothetical protein
MVITRSKKLKLEKETIMKGCIWNSDGFKDPVKHSVVHETIREFRLDYFAILETSRDNVDGAVMMVPENLMGRVDEVK